MLSDNKHLLSVWYKRVSANSLPAFASASGGKENTPMLLMSGMMQVNACQQWIGREINMHLHCFWLCYSTGLLFRLSSVEEYQEDRPSKWEERHTPAAAFAFVFQAYEVLKRASAYFAVKHQIPEHNYSVIT